MNEQHYEYRTGDTHPRKSSRGFIAFLLICVIFLAGIFSGLGLMNISLFRQEDPSADGLSFSQDDQQTRQTESADVLSLTLEGMTFQELPSLYQQMYDLPQGLYISRVDSAAGALGITAGDVLTAYDGMPVTTLEALQSLHSGRPAGGQVPLQLYRDGQTLSVTLTLK